MNREIRFVCDQVTLQEIVCTLKAASYQMKNYNGWKKIGEGIHNVHEQLDHELLDKFTDFELPDGVDEV